MPIWRPWGSGGAAGQDDERLVALGAGALLLRAISSARVSSVLPEGVFVSGLLPSARSLPGASANLTASVYSSS